jgi:hypothetical protein
LQSARAEYVDCASSATGAFQDALDGCLERDRECVDACRFERQECRDGTGAGVEVLECQAELARKKEECRNRFPLGSRRRELCIDRAQVAAFRCRRGVRRSFRRARRECGSAFRQCTDACGPGGPPGGAASCRDDAKAASRAALADCRQVYQVTASACLEKDVTCIQACAEARDACRAPTQAALDAAVRACTQQEEAAAAACAAANPGGGPALQDCLTTAQADAFACRDAALAAAAPGFATCTAQYLGCVGSCPPA